MPRQRRKAVRAHQLAAAREREELERRWLPKITRAPGLVPLVTARGARAEPFHRWFAYRQGFSPELVRLFLAEKRPKGPVLDPFNGSGTLTTESWRRGVPAIGVEAVGALARLARWRLARALPPWESRPEEGSWEALMSSAQHATQRAAVLCATSWCVDGEGHRRADAPSPSEAVARCLAMVAEDLRDAGRGSRIAVLQGDARALPLADAGIAGCLTSPPYLSRYDYARVNALLEGLCGGTGRRRGRRRQLRAAAALDRGRAAKASHPAAEEAAAALEAGGERSVAATVRGYFADIGRTVNELWRVLAPGAPLWIVIGAAAPKKEYVPADLVLAELAEAAGFTVEGVLEARRLVRIGRSLGTLRDVAPRESLLQLRRGPDR